MRLISWVTLNADVGIARSGLRRLADYATGRQVAAPADANPLWAELMRRSLGLDVRTCPRCGGHLTLIALIDDPAVIVRVLRHLGRPTDIPEAAAV